MRYSDFIIFRFDFVSLQRQLRWNFESALLIDKLRTMNVESEKTCNYE